MEKLKRREQNKKGYFSRLKKDVVRNKGLYLLSLPTFVFVIIFMYVPMVGILLAFKNYNSVLGIFGSPWIGFDNFKAFFEYYYFKEVLLNTVKVSLFSLLFGFPLPIVLALLLNSIKGRFKKVFQIVSYIPNFLSTVVVVAMLLAFLNPTSGIVNTIIKAFGGEAKDFITDPDWFIPVFVISGVWQSIGWSTVIYTSALSGVDTQLYDAAKIDGASKFQTMIHIDFPTILPTVIVSLILAVGGIMSVAFEKVYLLQNELNTSASEVISTYVYKMGLINFDYGFGTAVGLFNSVINFVLCLLVNFVAKKVSGYSIW